MKIYVYLTLIRFLKSICHFTLLLCKFILIAFCPTTRRVKSLRNGTRYNAVIYFTFLVQKVYVLQKLFFFYFITTVPLNFDNYYYIILLQHSLIFFTYIHSDVILGWHDSSKTLRPFIWLQRAPYSMLQIK